LTDVVWGTHLESNLIDDGTFTAASSNIVLTFHAKQKFENMIEPSILGLTAHKSVEGQAIIAALAITIMSVMAYTWKEDRSGFTNGFEFGYCGLLFAGKDTERCVPIAPCCEWTRTPAYHSVLAKLMTW
ncbi:hypothetical protein MKW98_002989, partial [Papaver atlanticum]